MPSTYTALHYHLIFSTKNRAPFIADSWRLELHRYLSGSVRGLDAHPIVIGGVADHVHALISLKPTHCLSDFMREFKKASSFWAHERESKFAWQEGYAAFSVSPSGLASVGKYISNQEEHHRKRTFREELIEFLTKSGVEYDERYLD